MNKHTGENTATGVAVKLKDLKDLIEDEIKGMTTKVEAISQQTKG